MATKNELVNFLKNQHGMQEDEDGILTANYELEGGERSQLALVTFDTFGDEETIYVMSAFAQIGQVSADKVFEETFFPVMTAGDYYVSARTLPIANLQPEEVTFLLGVTTAHADIMEQRLGLGDNF